MIVLGHGEPCPFCSGKDEFVNSPDNDFLNHLIKKHPDAIDTHIFGEENII